MWLRVVFRYDLKLANILFCIKKSSEKSWLSCVRVTTAMRTRRVRNFLMIVISLYLWYHIKKALPWWILDYTFISITILQMWLMTILTLGMRIGSKVCIWTLCGKDIWCHILKLAKWIAAYLCCVWWIMWLGWGVSHNDRTSQFNFTEMHYCVVQI